MQSYSDTALSSRDLSFQYPGGPVLSFPDLDVARGEVLLLLGSSGCGKTTLLQLLAGLLTPRTGSLYLAGQRADHGRAAKLDQLRGRHVGIVYQQPKFIATLTNWNNLRLSPHRAPDEAILDVARQLSIGHLLRKRPAEVSTGERQRLAIARALAHRPGIVLADEPTSALDRKNCLKVYELLRHQAEMNKAALIIVTHDERLQDLVPNQVRLSEIPLTKTPEK